MNEQSNGQHRPRKPLGNFEVAPEFNDAPHPLDVVYEHCHGLFVSDFEGFIKPVSSVIRGKQRPLAYVDLTVVDGNECINLSYTPAQARTLARMLTDAADDADAALATLTAEKKGGAA